MVMYWADTVSKAKDADIIVPFRDQELFQKTYPIEQYHSESYANLLLDCAAKALAPKEAAISLPLDWHFGPFCFLEKHLDNWTSHTGDMWDAQVCPIVYSVRKGLRVRTVPVPFVAPTIMKEMEEGNLEFVEKRLMQINFLDPKVKAAWTDEL